MDLTNFVPKRILVCQQRQIGDVLLTTPALELLKKHYPQSELHVFTEKKCAPVLEQNPYVTKIWGLDKHLAGSLWTEIPWYWKLARTGFDLVVDFQQLPRCRWIAAFSAAKIRLSFTPPWYNSLLYTHHASPVKGYAALSKASILQVLGVQPALLPPRIYLTEGERRNALQLLEALGLQRDHILITLDPTHRRVTRRWPLASYAETLHLLMEQNEQLRFLPLWGPGEEKEIRILAGSCGHPERLLLPREMLSLREMAACMEQARLHLGNCSAPRHFAVAMNTPSCVIRGATSDVWTYPSPQHVALTANLDCQPCERNTCDKNLRCLGAISPSLVARQVTNMLDHR